MSPPPPFASPGPLPPFRAHLARAGWDVVFMAALPILVVVIDTWTGVLPRPIGPALLLALASNALAVIAVLWLRSRHVPPRPGAFQAGPIEPGEAVPAPARMAIHALNVVWVFTAILLGHHLSPEGMSGGDVARALALVAFGVVVGGFWSEARRDRPASEPDVSGLPPAARGGGR